MLTQFPKDDSRFSWTRHIKNKMVFYGLSESRIKRVFLSPKRKEAGIAPETIAVMQRNDRGKKKEEIWVMYQMRGKKLKTDNQKLESPRRYSLATSHSSQLMISAWRYPGISKPGARIPIPDDILLDLADII